METDLWFACIVAALMFFIFIFVIIWSHIKEFGVPFYANIKRKCKEIKFFQIFDIFNAEECSNVNQPEEESKRLREGKSEDGKSDETKKENDKDRKEYDSVNNENRTRGPGVRVISSEIRTVNFKNFPPHYITLEVIRADS